MEGREKRNDFQGPQSTLIHGPRMQKITSALPEMDQFGEAPRLTAQWRKGQEMYV